jgi:hypothetical protein
MVFAEQQLLIGWGPANLHVTQVMNQHWCCYLPAICLVRGTPARTCFVGLTTDVMQGGQVS